MAGWQRRLIEAGERRPIALTAEDDDGRVAVSAPSPGDDPARRG